MGFGLIFTGYITLLFFKVLPPAMLVGAYLMWRGLGKLSIYGKKYRLARSFAALLAVYFALYTALFLGKIFRVFDVFSHTWFAYADDAVYTVLLIVFHAALYAALEETARVCGYEKGVKKIRFARVLVCMFAVFSVVSLLLAQTGAAAYLRYAAFLCQLVWYIHTAIFVYGFYMRVATQEIIDDEEKKIAEYDRKHTVKIGRKK